MHFYIYRAATKPAKKEHTTVLKSTSFDPSCETMKAEKNSS